MSRVLALAIAFATAACSSGDSGSGGDDTGTPDGGVTDPGPDGGNGNCTSDVVEAPTAAACAAATQTCAAACDTDECYDACLQADPDPDGCSTCLDDGYSACVNSAGCQAAWDTSACCYNGCADPESDACATSCAAQDAAWDQCIEQYDAQCTQMVATICYRAT